MLGRRAGRQRQNQNGGDRQVHHDQGGDPRRVRPGAVLAIVLVGQFMAVLDASIVSVAIPSMHAGLHASGAGLQLIVAGYTIAYAVLLVTGVTDTGWTLTVAARGLRLAGADAVLPLALATPK